MSSPMRGQVYMVDLPEVGGEKPFLVVSNNIRNRNLDSVICARITTSPRRPPDIPSVVPIEDRGAIVGAVLCDDLVTIAKPRLRRTMGALPRRVMTDVRQGLRSALGCELE